MSASWNPRAQLSQPLHLCRPHLSASCNLQKTSGRVGASYPGQAPWLARAKWSNSGNQQVWHKWICGNNPRRRNSQGRPEVSKGVMQLRQTVSQSLLMGAATPTACLFKAPKPAPCLHQLGLPYLSIQSDVQPVQSSSDACTIITEDSQADSDA